MKTIQFTTYKKSSKNNDKGRKRKSKIVIDLEVNKIMALTTAQGDGKWPRLYVADYGEPLELPNQSFEETKKKLIEASLSEYHNVNKFLSVGPKVLVNYDTVLRIRKTLGEVVFYDDQILSGLDTEILTEYEKQVEIEKNKPRKTDGEIYQEFFENLAKFQKELQIYKNKNANKITRKFGTLDDKLVTNGILVLINIVLSLILIIMIGILLYKL